MIRDLSKFTIVALFAILTFACVTQAIVDRSFSMAITSVFAILATMGATAAMFMDDDNE